ncbi:D-alanyl-D-alanine carboxypeptidase [Rhodococcus sp. 27YEA15]|uniref:serine hydrolase domain-containing protein n=1 Tax=Rhodococcus sp. 27YEA15 TaxID=3156259 RepID=UPI003C7B00F0
MRSQMVHAAIAVGATLAIAACSTLQRSIDIQADLDALVRSGAVGAIATLDDGTRTSVTTSGVPNRANGDSIGDNYRVRIGSVTESFTAVLVLLLVSEGRIQLDTPIQRYLPMLSGDAPWHGSTGAGAVTVRHLLQHRNGPSESAEGSHNGSRPPIADDPLTGAISVALDKPSQIDPGPPSVPDYTDVGTLVETVTGRSYADELRARILDPLGLHDTYLPSATEQDIQGDHMTGYLNLPAGLTDVTRIEPSLSRPGSALISTGKDLNTFWRALLDGKLLPEKELAEMTDSGSGIEADSHRYGIGVGVTELPCGVTYIGRSGGIHGYSTLSGATADRAFTVTMTSTTKTAPDAVSMLTHALCP